ncbi:MAG: aspartate 1-decarboxylase [Anaerolineae bacterium]
MMRSLLNGKIHRARVTTAEVDYEGSISLDRDLMAAAGLVENERVQVVDVTNGARLETYAIPAPAGSGTVQMNGAAAHLVEVGDLIIVMSWALVGDQEARDWHPTVVLVDDKNQVREVRRDRVDLLPA